MMPMADVRMTVGSPNHAFITGLHDNNGVARMLRNVAGIQKTGSDNHSVTFHFDSQKKAEAVNAARIELAKIGCPITEVHGILAMNIPPVELPQPLLPPLAAPRQIVAASSVQMVAISQIRMDGGTQPRAAMDEGKVAEYATEMQEGADFPAVTLFYDGSQYWLADGFHRVNGAIQAMRLLIKAEIHQGTQRDAILYSVGANDNHGLKRSNEDKRRAVARLLNDEEWGKWSNHEIARRCKVSDVYVGKLRKVWVTTNVCSENPDERTFTDKHGNETVMNVANIGAKVTIPSELEWLPNRLKQGAIEGWLEASLDHLKALAPLKDLDIAGAPMVATVNFHKRTQTPTPHALFNRLSTLGGLTVEDTQAIVSRMVAMCRPSANEVDASDFDEADFAELGQAGEGEPSEFERSETGVKGYFFVNGGKAVWCEFTNKTLTLAEFEAVKAKRATFRKKSGSSSSGGGHRTAEQVYGDSLAAGQSRGYVSQVERAQGQSPLRFIKSELAKMDEGVIIMLSVAIANGTGDEPPTTDEIGYVAQFVVENGSVR